MPHRRKDELTQRILSLESQIESIKAELPYADGPAYSQDKKRIFMYQREVTELKHMLKQQEGEDD